MNALRFFPSRTVMIYMARKFLVTSFAVLLMLVLVLLALDLLGESGDILAWPGNGNAEILRYAGLRAPQIVQTFLPFAVLLGTLLTLATMNQHSEIIAMKAAGISAHQVLAPLIFASLVVAVLSFAFNDRIVARATAALDAWSAAEYGPVQPGNGVGTNVWVRDGDDLIHADTAAGRGDAVRLGAVTIYDRSGGTLQSIVQAPRAVRAGTGWRLDGGVRRFDVVAGKVTRMPAMPFGEGITPDRFTLSAVDAEDRSFLSLYGAIGDLRAAGRPTGGLEAGLWHKLSGPLSSVLMPLLAGVAAFGLARSGQLFIRAVIGMALGFAYFVVDNFALSMGSLGAYPPFLAAWAPFFLFLLVGEAVLIRTEE